MQDGSGKSDTGFSTENVISFAGFTQALEKTYDVVEPQGPDGTAGSEMPGMIYLTKLFAVRYPEIEFKHINCGEVYTYTD